MPACRDIPYVLDKLSWMRAERIWPNGQRYTWTDAFGVVLLVSLYAELGKQRFLDEAEWVVSDVDRVLGRPRGIRIGEAPDRDGQYFHYLAMWLYALSVLARHVPTYRRKGVDLVHQIHRAFVMPGRGVDRRAPSSGMQQPGAPTASREAQSDWPLGVSVARCQHHSLTQMGGPLSGAKRKTFACAGRPARSRGCKSLTMKE